MPAMPDAILVYFNGEKHAGVTIAVLGLLGVVAALLLWQPRWELRSLAVVLGVMGLLELAVGVGLYLKTGPQIDQLLAQLGADAPRLQADELARMIRVQRNFVVLQVLWLALMAASAAVALTQKGRPALWGAALGLLVQAAVFLAFDLVAERRGAAYLAALSVRR